VVTTEPGARTTRPPGRLVCGVDLGASAAKLVLLDETLLVRAGVVRHSGVDYAATARACLAEALAVAGEEESSVARTVATGYGRRNVPFADANATEIHCQGVGCHHLFPAATTIVDIGGQDNKVIRLGSSGRRVSFKMNRKCAAGTGAFVEEIALRLGLDVSAMEPLAATSPEAVTLSSFCTVFAKTEILTHLRAGVPAAAIVRGAFESVVQRVMEMDPLDGEVVLTGGVVAHNPTVAVILAARLGRGGDVPERAQLTGALGAALTALRQLAAGTTAEDTPPAGGEGKDVEADNA
jgi:(R)-2-hydroxyacyl-CoA dehydratese activating ATPase